MAPRKKPARYPTRTAIESVDHLAVALAGLHLSFQDLPAKPSDAQRMVVTGFAGQAIEYVEKIMASLSAVAAVIDPAAFAEAHS